MTEAMNVNRAAPLKNVAAFSTLLTRMVEREYYLPGLACFFGPSGWGKTESAVFAANNHRATYIECGMYTTARSMLHDILVERGVRGPKGTIQQLLTQAVMMIAAEPHRPLIVDEAHWIGKRGFVDVLRELSDKSGAAVILIGEEMLPGQLASFERVHNRVLEWLPAQPCDMGDFIMLAKKLCRNAAIAPDLASEILKVTDGNTRRIVNNLAEVAKVAQLQGLTTVDLSAFGGSAAIKGRTSIQPRHYK